MKDTQQNFAVLFADVANSTHIFEICGNTEASRIINKLLTRMTVIVEQNDGTLVKTIGDEIMGFFFNVDNAIEAACQINKAIEAMSPVNDLTLAIRTGIDWGPAVEQENGDLLGDVVIVASRMTDIAQAGQIITTEDVVSKLSPELKNKCREFDRAAIKGKLEPLVIYEVVWEPREVTQMGPKMENIPFSSTSALDISYHNLNKTMSSESRPIYLGRSDHCELVIDSTLASRKHATIKFSRGKYILIDQSTNGTYVRFDNGKEFYIRRENMPLSESGKISLGENFNTNRDHLITYRV